MKNRKIASTKRILKAMLTENTGIALLDSGGAYGRNWERNQGRDFDSESPAFVRFDVRYWIEQFHKEFPQLEEREPELIKEIPRQDLEIEITHNVYHFLADRLIYDAKMNQKFQRWAKRHDPDNDKGWLELMEGFTHSDLDLIESCGGGNTYNGEDTLSQVLQYELFTYDGDPYVLLQIHGGCDVRGGYTMPRVFAMDDEYSLFDNAFGEIDCPHCRAYWRTDDAYHFYYEGTSGLNAGKQLEKYPAIEEDSEEGWLCAWRLDHGESLDFDHLHNTYDYPERFVFVREDNTAICPLCGVGVLKGY